MFHGGDVECDDDGSISMVGPGKKVKSCVCTAYKEYKNYLSFHADYQTTHMLSNSPFIMM